MEVDLVSTFIASFNYSVYITFSLLTPDAFQYIFFLVNHRLFLEWRSDKMNTIYVIWQSFITHQNWEMTWFVDHFRIQTITYKIKYTERNWFRVTLISLTVHNLPLITVLPTNTNSNKFIIVWFLEPYSRNTNPSSLSITSSSKPILVDLPDYFQGLRTCSILVSYVFFYGEGGGGDPTESCIKHH